MTALADRLAARTLELVDIPSESGSESCDPRAPARARSAGWATEYAGDEAFLFVGPGASECAARRARRPLRHRARAGQPSGTDRRRRRARAWRERHEGRPRRRASSSRATSSRESAPCDLALLLFGREELPAEHNPLPALFDASRACHETTLAVVLEPTDLEIQAGCLGNVVARLDVPRDERARRGPGSPTARSSAPCEGSRRSVRPRAARGRRRRPRVPRGRVGDAARRGNRRQRHPRARRPRPLNLRYPPDRDAGRAAEPYLADARSRRRDARGRRATPLRRGRRRLTGCAGAAGSRAIALEPKQAWTNVADFTTRGISTRSTSARVTRRSRITPTSTSRSRRSSRPTRCSRPVRRELDRRRCRLMELAQRIDDVVGKRRARAGADRRGDRAPRRRRACASPSRRG